MAIDHPPRWVLERTPEHIVLKRLASANEREARVPISELVQRGSHIKIPSPTPEIKDRSLLLTIRPLHPIRPAYLPLRETTAQYDESRPGQLFLFWGTRYFLIDFKALGKSFEGGVERARVFRHAKSKSGYVLTAHCPGLRFKVAGEARREIPVGHTYVLTERQLIQGRLEWDKHWWRVNRVPTPDPLAVEEMENQQIRDSTFFRRLSFIALAGFLMFGILLKMFPVSEIPKEKKKESTEVILKLPKFLPPEPKKEQKQKPKPPKKEKPKPTPKPKPKPVKKVEPAKLPPKPTPPKAMPKPPPPQKIPPKPVIAPPPPPKVVQPPVVPTPNPEAEAAKARAQLAKSLNFLSPSKNKPVTNIQNEKVNSRYNTVGNVDDPKKANANLLNNIATSKKIDGPIETKNARNVRSDLELSGQGKALNEVQGKVSLNALNASDMGELGSAVSGKGITMIGSGTVNESEIEKALAKHLSKFQYCYEKALLTDSTLGGVLLMQWTIDLGGNAQDQKVLRSQLSNAALHSCMIKELGKVSFPKPSGGVVTIKYPFKFSSSQL